LVWTDSRGISFICYLDLSRLLAKCTKLLVSVWCVIHSRVYTQLSDLFKNTSNNQLSITKLFFWRVYKLFDKIYTYSKYFCLFNSNLTKWRHLTSNIILASFLKRDLQSLFIERGNERTSVGDRKLYETFNIFLYSKRPP